MKVLFEDCTLKTTIYCVTSILCVHKRVYAVDKWPCARIILDYKPQDFAICIGPELSLIKHRLKVCVDSGLSWTGFCFMPLFSHVQGRAMRHFPWAWGTLLCVLLHNLSYLSSSHLVNLQALLYHSIEPFTYLPRTRMPTGHRRSIVRELGAAKRARKENRAQLNGRPSDTLALPEEIKLRVLIKNISFQSGSFNKASQGSCRGKRGASGENAVIKQKTEMPSRNVVHVITCSEWTPL